MCWPFSAGWEVTVASGGTAITGTTGLMQTETVISDHFSISILIAEDSNNLYVQSMPSSNCRGSLVESFLYIINTSHVRRWLANQTIAILFVRSRIRQEVFIFKSRLPHNGVSKAGRVSQFDASPFWMESIISNLSMRERKSLLSSPVCCCHCSWCCCCCLCSCHDAAIYSGRFSWYAGHLLHIPWRFLKHTDRASLMIISRMPAN